MMKCPNHYTEEQCETYKSAYRAMNIFLADHIPPPHMCAMPGESHLAVAWSKGLADAAEDFKNERNE